MATDRIPKSAFQNLFRELSLLLHGGIPLLRSLDLAISSLPQKKATPFKELMASVEGGSSLSNAFSILLQGKYPLIAGVIRVGEATGTLAESFECLATSLAEEEELKQKLKATLMYPIAVFATSILSLLFFLFVILPTLVSVLYEMGSSLPPLTLLILQSIEWGIRAAILGLGVGVGCYLLTHWGPWQDTLKRRLHRFLLWIPLLGSCLKTYHTAQVFRALQEAMKAGLPILNALSLAKQTTPNLAFQEVIAKIEKSVQQGEPLHDAIAGARTFPYQVAALVGAAEEGGNLTECFRNIYQIKMKEFERSLKNSLSLLEPISVLSVGVIVGLVVIGMFLPLLQVMNSL